MKVILQVDGREVILSEDELIAIARKKLFNNATVEECKTPTEGKAFAVNPSEINRKLFSTKRKDEKQERTRQLILEAFAEVDKNPGRYAKPFKTLMPEKTWRSKTVNELEKLANSSGDHLADWVEQAMEWAQRIANGETWKTVCNDPDTANWYRLVKWKNGYYRIVGGSRKYSSQCPASDVHGSDYNPNYDCSYPVPLVVL